MNPKVIDISKLESNVLDLKYYRGNSVYLEGTYTGDKLIVKNVNTVNVYPLGIVVIESSHAEDALILQNPDSVIFENPNKNVYGRFVLNGAITVWGDCKEVMLKDFTIYDAHTGIRINQPGHTYKNITIEDCIIEGCSHEGIYIGTSRETHPPTNSVTIVNCIVKNCGWDGIQIGNTQNFVISKCFISDCGLLCERGQDFDITINPGSLGHINSTQWNGKIQLLESRVFIHK